METIDDFWFTKSGSKYRRVHQIEEFGYWMLQSVFHGFVNLLTSQQEVHNLEANPYDDVPVFPSQADSPSQAAHKPK
ncbi:predicted protein, partial [Arabidopsis lyrata subsp. lyrata]